MGETGGEKGARGGVRARTWLPWLAALLLLGALAARTDLPAMRRALGGADWLPLGGYALVQVLGLLAVDAFATRAALAAAGIRRGHAEVALARGATYLLGLVSFVAGQGGIGVWAARTGAGASRATGAVAFLVATNGLALAAVAGAGLLAALGLPLAPVALPRGIAPAVAAVAAAGAAYLVAVAAAPGRLERLPWPALRATLAPLVDAGPGGHLRAVAWRLPHVLVMILFHWGAFRLWGIAVPLAAGLVLVPVVLLVAALPVTPGGLGTTQAAQVLLFSPWVAGATVDERAASVLAFSLAFYAVSLVAQAGVGLACLALLQSGVGGPRRAEEPVEGGR